LIDLHTHSDESDGSWSPSRLVEEGLKIGLEALAIADHDTIKGHALAAGPACAGGLDLVCAVEIGTVFPQRQQPPIRHVHVLGYFLNSPPAAGFRSWLAGIQEGRSNRNRLLAERLQSLGLDVPLEEAQAMGSGLTGRPHFARVLVRKGYATDVQDAFDKYLGRSGKAYVPRREPSAMEAIGQIIAAGGLAVLAHPGRLPREEPDLLGLLVRELVERGLGGLEVYHSDHTAADTQLLLGMAESYGLAITGGSDFHGEAKPGVELGTGHAGNLSIPREVLERMRTSAAHRPRG
jgi:hypothetical protein